MFGKRAVKVGMVVGIPTIGEFLNGTIIVLAVPI